MCLRPGFYGLRIDHIYHQQEDALCLGDCSKSLTYCVSSVETEEVVVKEENSNNFDTVDCFA